MKIVINKNHPPFALSQLAIKELILIDSKLISSCSIEDYWGEHHRELHRENYYGKNAVDLGDGFHGGSYDPSVLKDNKIYWLSSTNDIDFRKNPDLLNIIELLGEKANGKSSKLKIVEVPDDIECFIDVAKNEEFVAEKHRRWF